ncbi:MAG TPA: hypothetical protein VGI70_18505, partial [Polyangiales bacterium]
MPDPTTFRKILSTLLLCGAAAAMLSGCELGAYPPSYGGYDESADYPPPDYVATAAPVYYEGRPAYRYHDHW